jgi:hypothetical protein
MQKLLQLGLSTGQLNKAIAIALNGPSKEECGLETQARHIWSWTNTWWPRNHEPQSAQLPEVKALKRRYCHPPLLHADNATVPIPGHPGR